MPNEYMWAQTACSFPGETFGSNQSNGSPQGGYESKQQSSQMPRNYQPEPQSYGGGAQYSSPPSSSYGGQGSRSSSYTHQPSSDKQYYAQEQQQQPQRQQYSSSRTSSYASNGGNHGASNGGSSDFVEQSVSIDDLSRENFIGQGSSSSSSVKLPEDLLRELKRASPRGRDSKLYFLEPQSGGNSIAGMLYPTSDLDLINQLAVKHHRHTCMRKIGGDGRDLAEKVLRGTEWSLLDGERLELTTSVSVGNGQRMTINTTVQELSLFRQK